MTDECSAKSRPIFLYMVASSVMSRGFAGQVAENDRMNLRATLIDVE